VNHSRFMTSPADESKGKLVFIGHPPMHHSAAACAGLACAANQIIDRGLHAAFLVRDAGNASAISVIASAPASMPSSRRRDGRLRKYLPAYGPKLEP